MTIQLFYECNEEVYFLQIFYIWTPECPGHFREGEQAYLSIKTGLDAMDTSYDDLLHVKGWPVTRFWYKSHNITIYGLTKLRITQPSDVRIQ